MFLLHCSVLSVQQHCVQGNQCTCLNYKYFIAKKREASFDNTNLQSVENAVSAKCGKVKYGKTRYACIRPKFHTCTTDLSTLFSYKPPPSEGESGPLPTAGPSSSTLPPPDLWPQLLTFSLQQALSSFAL